MKKKIILLVLLMALALPLLTTGVFDLEARRRGSLFVIVVFSLPQTTISPN